MHPADWIVLTCYAALILGIGWRAGRGERSAHDHLRAGRSLPGWAVVFSVLATEISAVTYVSVPSSAFMGNWTYIQFAIGALLGKIALSYWFIRLYWRLNLDTVYGFLGQRIGPHTQKSTAAAFIAGRLIASGVRLYVAALAFAVVTGFDTPFAIGVMAAISTVYTVCGGLKAVVWTDVAQGSIFFIGAATAIGVGLWKLGMPIADVFSQAIESGKLHALELAPKGGLLASTTSLPVALIGGFFLVLATHGTDQENVQHLLNTRTERASSRSLLSSGLFTFPVVALFLSVGTMLWVYHRHLPPDAYGLESPQDQKNIFPHFIMHVLPAGLRGLVFAGLFAAAVSSLGATLNAVTTAFVRDIMPVRGRESVGRIRGLMLVFGLTLALIGLYFYRSTHDQRADLVQVALGAMTILYGGILGTFLVALRPPVARLRDGWTLACLMAGVVVGAAIFFQKELFGLEDVVVSWPWSIPLAAGTTYLLVLAGGSRR